MDIDGKSLDITQDNLAKLKQLFPNLVKEGEIDLNELKATFGQEPTLHEERYGLSWAGKYDAFKQVQAQISHTLLPDRANSLAFDRTENVFIEGENLDVLKILQKSYYGQIKMIYIDPPYNTGNDHFIYPDKYAESKEDYLQRSGVKDERGYLNKADLFRKNSRENGQFHSVWLSMMYPRLYLARNLLCEDGVIFVSIDDNEVANLRLLMDEVFGEENFVASIIWQKKYAVSNDDQGIGVMHDYILVYRKSPEFIRNLLPRTEKQLKRYINLDNDLRGIWSSDNYISNKSKEERPTLYYPIIHPKTGEEVWPDENAVWRYSKEKHKTMVKENRLYWGPDQSYKIPRLKRFLGEIQDGVVPNTWWSFEEVGHNDEAQKETFSLIGKKIFTTPKPVRLLNRILQVSTSKDKGDIVLDFFSGSSTLAQAVLEMNKEDGGNRKSICVQLPEETSEDSQARKAGYETIAAIGRARIRKVIEQMNAEQATQLPLEPRPTLGFRSFILAASNFKIWRGDVKLENEILTQLALFQQPAQSGNEEAMLWELLLKAGYPLSAQIEAREVEGITLYFINEGELIIALQAINQTVVEIVRQAKPNAFICLDSLFNQDDPLKTDTSLQFQDEGIIFKTI